MVQLGTLQHQMLCCHQDRTLYHPLHLFLGLVFSVVVVILFVLVCALSDVFSFSHIP